LKRRPPPPYRLHQHVYEAWSPPDHRRLLYRLEGQQLIVQSDWHPEIRDERLPRGAWLLSLQQWDDVAALLPVGKRFRFRIRCNPTWRDAAGVRRGVGTDRKEGPAQLTEWLATRLDRGGANPLEVCLIAWEVVKDRNYCWWTAHYEGAVRVSDPARLAELVRSGIGSARSFGYGLLALYQTAENDRS
jgi:CRISPR system Cascade subunit CasE